MHKAIYWNTIRGDTMTTFRLYTYDVWGNEKDGYEVNDIFKTSETYEIPAEATDAHVIKALRKQGCFKARVLSRLIEIDGDDETIYVSYKGRPEFELRKGA